MATQHLLLCGGRSAVALESNCPAKCQNLPNIGNEKIITNKNPVLFRCTEWSRSADRTLISSAPNPPASSSQEDPDVLFKLEFLRWLLEADQSGAEWKH